MDGVIDERVRAIVLRACGARSLGEIRVVQELWSGYGKILRCPLVGSARASAIVKRVRWPTEATHPRGWNSDRGHRRKVRSYAVETEWYRHYATRCDARCRVPEALWLATDADGVLLVLEDLDAAGFGERCRTPGSAELEAGLAWLAEFHATFMSVTPRDLWPTGTYWHLETRPDELAALPPGALKDAAAPLDAALRASPFQTLVHGDAKLANFCFSANGRDVAAVDFQYVGGGCGMKDVAYFISSCLDEVDSEALETRLLDLYFERLGAALARRQPAIDFEALHRDWRALYPVAWTDFYRFLQGWSPGHWKIHAYSERLAREVLEAL
ncbi:MAG: phosphotransferase [Myxococcota bacterium]